MKLLLLSLYFLLCCSINSNAQSGSSSTVENDSLKSFFVANDSLYREDQFYVALSYNLIDNRPDNFSQNGFSGGLHLGFIRDMPFNKERTWSIGLGLGFSRNIYNTNLFIGQEPSGNSSFVLIEDVNSINSNILSFNQIDIPFQIRWRNSTPTEHNFWRVYPGFRLGYIFSHKSNFKNDGISVKRTDIAELEKLRYAATLTVGNGGFNAFVMYDLNPLFNNNAVINNQQINLQPIKFGIEFYIL